MTSRKECGVCLLVTPPCLRVRKSSLVSAWPQRAGGHCGPRLGTRTASSVPFREQRMPADAAGWGGGRTQGEVTLHFHLGTGVDMLHSARCNQSSRNVELSTSDSFPTPMHSLRGGDGGHTPPPRGAPS